MTTVGDPRYGVHVQTRSSTEAERAAESLRLLGYAVLPARADAARLGDLRERFDALRERRATEHGVEALRALDEHNTVRGPLASEPAFLELARDAVVLELCAQLLGPGFILNQQNGIVNPAREGAYNQAAWHRDLPYQHFTSSRPLGLNALFCLDDFTADNGATRVVPASHKVEALPSDAVIAATEREVTAPAGSFIVLDCMTYHRGGSNRSAADRRAVNHVYTIGLMRQQIDLPAWLGEDFAAEPALRQLLGYDYRSPRSAAEYYEGCRRKRR